MKYAFICLSFLCLTTFAAVPQPSVKILTPVGVCHFGPDCQGPELGRGVTAQYCAHMGGHSIRYSTSCRSF